MKLSNFKTLATVSAFALGLSLASGAVMAQTVQDDADIDVVITIDSSLDIDSFADAHYGSWFIVHDGANDFTLTLNPDDTITLPIPATLGDGQAVDIDDALRTAGQIVVAGPGPIDMSMRIATVADTFDSAANGLQLQRVLYETSEGESDFFDVSAVTAAPGAETPWQEVTLAADGSLTVDLGARILFTSTPADGTYTETYNIEIGF